MKTVGDWVALVCFVSLAALGWVVILRGVSWPVVFAALWFVVIGTLAGVRPAEWQRREGRAGK